MDVNVPFRWHLSSQKLKKLNSCFSLRKYLCNVMNVKWYLLLVRKKSNAFIKVIGISPLKSAFVKVYTRIIFFRFSPLTAIDFKKLKLSKFRSKYILLKSAVRRVIDQRNRLVVKGKIKVRILERKDSGSEKKSVTENKPALTLLPNIMPTCTSPIPQTFVVEELKVIKQETIYDKCIAKLMPESNMDCRIKLSKDLETMFNSCTYSDVIIICQSQEFRAHKAILKARCPALLESLKEDPDETKVITTINIDCLPVLVVKTLLFYIYTGKLESVTLYLACDLIYAANIYNLKTLKDICMDFVANSLCDENAIFIYSFSSYSADELLKSLALKYITQNFSSISNSTIWKQFKRARPDLSTGILSEIVLLMTPPMIDLSLE